MQVDLIDLRPCKAGHLMSDVLCQIITTGRPLLRHFSGFGVSLPLPELRVRSLNELFLILEYLLRHGVMAAPLAPVSIYRDITLIQRLHQVVTIE